MKEYELTVLIHPDLEVDLEAPLDKVRNLVKENGGEIIKEDNWGKKRLAYRIKNQDFAVYVYMDVNITDEVIRYLLVKVDEKGRKALEDAKARAKERGEDAEDEE